ncbi:hypothetical protein ACFLZW_02490 [Chloroflexota bacterium]
MSEVISFRLNKDNLREAKALLVLQEWSAKGYVIRQTIAEALLSLDQNETKPESAAFNDLSKTQSQVNHLLRQIESGNSSPVTKRGENQGDNGLSTSFVASVKMSARSGLKLD